MSKIFFDIVVRIKELQGFKTDQEVASFLKMSKTAFSNHKTRGTVPYEKLLTASKRLGVSLDWLLSGEGPKYRKEDATGEQAGLMEFSLTECDPAKPEIKLSLNQAYKLSFSDGKKDKPKFCIMIKILDPEKIGS